MKYYWRSLLGEESFNASCRSRLGEGVRALTADLQQTPSNQKNYRAEELPGFNGFDRVTFLDFW